MTQQLVPKVSVCMPVWNGSAYIAESIESVLAQTYKDFELIICDNCSTDTTPEIVRSYKDARVKYFKNDKNLGPIGNVNRCIGLARGEYLNIFHHDDYMFPDNLEHKIRILDDNPDVGFVHSNLFVTDAEGQVLYEWNEDSRRNYIENGRDVFRRYILRINIGALIFIGAVMARRICYNRLGGFQQGLTHAYDNEMWMRILLFYDVACVEKPLVTWRQHSTSESSKWDLDIAFLEEHFLATQMIFKSFSDRIFDCKNLKRQVEENFLSQALSKGINACGKDDFDLANNYLIFAKKIEKNLLTRKNYWRLKMRLKLGIRGYAFCRNVKNKFGYGVS